MAKLITFFNAAFSCILLTASNASAQPPAPVPLAEPAYLDSVEQAVEVEGTDSVKAKSLPDIVKCCPLSTISLSKASATESLKNETLPVPPNEAAEYLKSQGTQFAESSYAVPVMRHAESVYYQPLYFEDPNLERCGAGHGIATELVSAVRFFGRAPLIPYMVGSQNPHQCVRSLGDCTVCQRYGKSAYLPKLNPKGVAFQTAATLGLVFLFP